MLSPGTAHRRVQDAIKAGRMSNPDACEVCGRPQYPERDGRHGVQWHHWSYLPEHATDCIPLCRSCHSRVHHGRIAEPRTGRIYASRGLAQIARSAGPLVSFLADRPDGALRRELLPILGCGRSGSLTTIVRAGFIRREPTGARHKDAWRYFAASLA